MMLIGHFDSPSSLPLTGNTNGTNGTNGTSFNLATPGSVTVAYGTVYQAPDPTKPCEIKIHLRTNYAITVGALSYTDVSELYIASTNNISTTGGTRVDRYETSLTGILALVGLSTIDSRTLYCKLPVGWYFCLRRVSGTTTTVNYAIAQSLV